MERVPCQRHLTIAETLCHRFPRSEVWWLLGRVRVAEVAGGHFLVHILEGGVHLGARVVIRVPQGLDSLFLTCDDTPPASLI